MWLQLIFTRSFIFYCAPLVLCIALYHWSKKGVGGWCSVPLKPKREAQHLSGELVQVKVFAWKSNADKSNRPIISQAVFILLHLSGIATREATSPAEVPQRRTTFLHDANQKKMRTHRPLTASLSLPATSSKLAPWIKLLDLNGEREAVVRDKLGAQLRQNCTK